MSENTTRELEVMEVFDYPKPMGKERKFMVIEYEVTKKEINRYQLVQRKK